MLCGNVFLGTGKPRAKAWYNLLKVTVGAAKNKLSSKLTLDSSGATLSPLSIATSIIHAASQVCSTSGTSTTNHPLPSSNTVKLGQKLLSPKIPDESQALSSTPKDIRQTTPKASDTTKDESSSPKDPKEPSEIRVIMLPLELPY